MTDTATAPFLGDLDDGPGSGLLCDVCGQEAQSAAGLASHKRNRHPDAPAVADLPPEGEKPKRTLMSRLWGEKAPKPEKPARPKALPKRGKRVSAATLLGMPFTEGANMVAGWKPCTARMLQAQAPWAGHVLDEAIAGTFADRMVQPFARNAERFGMIGSVIGPPLFVFQLESNPKAAPVIIPALRRSLRMAAPFMLRGMAKKKAADEDVAKAFREAYPDAPPDMTPDEMIDSLIQDVLGPMLAAQTQPQEQETPNGN